MKDLRAQYEEEIAMDNDCISHKHYMLDSEACYQEWLQDNGTLSHYFKQVGDQFQLYISYDGEHFHFIAQRPSLAVLTAMASEIYRDNA